MSCAVVGSLALAFARWPRRGHALRVALVARLARFRRVVHALQLDACAAAFDVERRGVATSCGSPVAPRTRDDHAAIVAADSTTRERTIDAMRRAARLAAANPAARLAVAEVK